MRRHRPEPVDDLLPESREVAHDPGTREPSIQLELLRLVGHVVVGQARLERQVDDGLWRRRRSAARPSRFAFCSSTDSASIRE